MHNLKVGLKLSAVFFVIIVVILFVIYTERGRAIDREIDKKIETIELIKKLRYIAKEEDFARYDSAIIVLKYEISLLEADIDSLLYKIKWKPNSTEGDKNE